MALVGVTFLLAWLTYKLVETPLRFGKSGGAKAIGLILGMAAIGVTGMATNLGNGFEGRAAVALSANAKVTDQFVGALWPYTKNAACLERHPFAAAKSYRWWFCVTNRNEAPTLLVLGNSYANQLYPGLVKQNALRHHTVLSIGTCGPEKVDRSRPTETPSASPCSGDRPRQQEDLIDEIVKNNTSLRFVILAGLNREPDSDYIERVTQRIDFFEQHSIKVIVFVPMIEMTVDIRSCFPRPLKRPNEGCHSSSSTRTMLLMNFQPLIDRLSETNPSVVFFDQNDLLCDTFQCSMVRDGMPLFRDEFHHLSEFASVELADRFARWAADNRPELLIQ